MSNQNSVTGGASFLYGVIFSIIYIFIEQKCILMFTVKIQQPAQGVVADVASKSCTSVGGGDAGRVFITQG